MPAVAPARAAISGLSRPALLAATAMMTAVGESTYPVVAGIKWTKSYHAALATPIAPPDLVTGLVGFLGVRVLFNLLVYAGVMVLMNAMELGPAVAAVFPAALTGLAFATPVIAWAAKLDDDRALASFFRFGVMPLFLFSGTFYPVSQLPDWVQPIVWLSPLFHGIELSRGAAGLEGSPQFPWWVHLVFLARSVCGRTFRCQAQLHQEAVDLSSIVAPRIAPPMHRPGARAVRLLERNFILYKRIWIILFSGFFEPVFYLLSIGFGVGALIDEITLSNGRAVSYAAFVAPAMLASSAMNGAVYESTLNVFFRLKWGKIYDGMLATPLGAMDVALGEIAWSQIRGTLYSIAFVIVMLVFGLIESWWAILAVPVALLIGFAFAGVGMAATTFMKGWQDFDLVQLVTQPLFLFSGTFFPDHRLSDRLAATGLALAALSRRRTDAGHDPRHFRSLDLWTSCFSDRDGRGGHGRHPSAIREAFKALRSQRGQFSVSPPRGRNNLGGGRFLASRCAPSPSLRSGTSPPGRNTKSLDLPSCCGGTCSVGSWRVSSGSSSF